MQQETLEEVFRLKENDPRCLQDRHFKYKDIDRLAIKGLKRNYYVNIQQKNAGMAILSTL